MAKLTDTEARARALRDLYAVRYALSTWGFIWRTGLLTIWLSSVVYRLAVQHDPTWLTVVFAIVFTVVSREVWDGVRRRRYEKWNTEQLFREDE